MIFFRAMTWLFAVIMAGCSVACLVESGRPENRRERTGMIVGAIVCGIIAVMGLRML